MVVTLAYSLGDWWLLHYHIRTQRLIVVMIKIMASERIRTDHQKATTKYFH